jgi:hypothetical protein
MCVDYRLLNSRIIQAPFPLPRINEILDTIGEKHPKLLSSLDIFKGYYHMKLHDESKPYTAFTTGSGQYQFTRTPQGLKSSASHFLHLMAIILQGLDSGIAESYVDDILCLSQTFKKHISDLQDIFDRLRRADLKLSPKKCSFGQQSVSYLGHILETNGTMSIDPQKIEIIRDYPKPTSTKKVRQCMGFLNYYRKFCDKFSETANPLHCEERNP